MKRSLPPIFTERHRTAIELRERKHYTFRQIGEKLGVRPGRAREIYQAGVSRRTFTPECFYGLTCRTVQSLENLCLYNREEVLAAVMAGQLTAKSGPRNFGKKMEMEIRAWLGLSDL